jgi:hypothetical protein
VVNPAGAIGRAEPFRHNALAAERAGIIAVELVGGNGGKGSFQFSCRKYLAEKSTD